jgi:mannose-1-phosphate guanylyltransferase/mannose-1-phosphate guanylyltransferase/mannose-6-phosphate isomerase
MTRELIHPVILCGGSGTRLWPLSRKQAPKPFLPLVAEETLFEEAVRRVSKDDLFAPITVVAGAAHCELITAQLGGAPKARLIVEPTARNTAPAIALAAALLPEDAVMLICPSDHHIANVPAFQEAAAAAALLAREDRLVSFGIKPLYPETGYGYLEHGEPLTGGFEIRRFVEKPDLATAKEYLESGKFSWNGGIFAFRAGYFLNELSEHRPEMSELVRQSVAQGSDDGARFCPALEPFAAIDGDSVDYAVMEKTARAAMVPVEMGWSDIGNWAALSDALADKSDEAKNIKRFIKGHGAVDFDQCRGVFAMTDGPRISIVGLTDICVVVSGGEVLITSREGAQRVGKLPGAVNQ